VEDLDRSRVRPGVEETQLSDLRALGLDWDGPVVRQSERMELYEEAIAHLDTGGLLYPCYCTRAEIRAAASAPHGIPASDRYPGTCREFTTAQRAVREASGRPPALRVRSDNARVAFDDRLLGRREEEVDDFVVRRNDGTPAYQLAVVVDDAAQGIGEVVRGADLADSTPRQVLLAGLLGLPDPDTLTSPSCSARTDGVSPNATAPSRSPTVPPLAKDRRKHAPGWPAHSASPAPERPRHPTILSRASLRNDCLASRPSGRHKPQSEPHSMVPFPCSPKAVSAFSKQRADWLKC
jgi:hypothetical protein